MCWRYKLFGGPQSKKVLLCSGISNKITTHVFFVFFAQTPKFVFNFFLSYFRSLENEGNKNVHICNFCAFLNGILFVFFVKCNLKQIV